MTWLKNTNATVSDVVCVGPEDMKGKRLNDMTSLQNECVSTGEKHLSQLPFSHVQLRSGSEDSAESF